MKLKTARTLKWNTIEKFSSQILYAVTGIVLANVLSKDDFGLVGSVLIFQAFASLFVDSGFSSALIQKQKPTDTDYSTVFYFNLGMSIVIYILLWFFAPFIADIFNDSRLVDLSRVMFLTFILNATAIVQTNRLMKQMNVKMIAVSSCVGLIVSGAVGIIMALNGYGAWSIVWQSIVLAAVKSLILWITTKWAPKLEFSWQSLKSIFAVGFGVMTTSFLNTVFLNIYSFVIGVYYNLTQLGIYTQADKWSKMGISSLSQVFTASFLPLLSEYQDDRVKYHNVMAKTNRFVGYILFPCFGILLMSAEPIFHILFDTKWDAAIILFQILLLRGIFTVLTSLYNNYILSIGRAKLLVYSEIVKDVLTIGAIFATLSYDIEGLIWGQFFAGAGYYIFSLIITSHATGYSIFKLVKDLVPYIGITLIAISPLLFVEKYIESAFIILPIQLMIGFGIYLLFNYLLKSKIQKDVIGYAFGRFRKK